MKVRKAIFLVVALLTARAINLAAETDGGDENPVSFNFNVSSAVDGSGAFYINRPDFKGGFDLWVNARISGNVGKTVSYFADIGVALLCAERDYAGQWPIKVGSDEAKDVYSQPVGYFPYTYNSAWGGFVFPLSSLDAGGPTGWPDSPSIGFNVISEIAGSALDDVLRWRMGRIGREAASVVEGSSLVLNKASQPFFGVDMQFNLSPGIYLHGLTGMLEYYDANGIYTSPQTFQNAFSLFMLSFKNNRHFQIEGGSTAIWPKRFELGYLYPFTIPLLYKNIGDFDNLGLFGNIKLQYPGVGFVWFSLFVDEMNFEKDFFSLDREMYAFQAGLRYLIPSLSFGSLTVSYTKIEPYCYTHQKMDVPWYNVPMEVAYTNHGYGLGYYLPPNSDEIKIAFAMMTASHIAVHTQFQMIRHGADYGGSLVYGSSYVSELQESGRSSNPALWKYFLHDGAYQWTYIAKAGVNWDLPKFPASLFGEAGMVFSYFTDIEPGKAKSGKKYPYSKIDTLEYPQSTSIIVSIGCKVVLY